MYGRFEFALEHIQASQWESFERLASIFLASEFDRLRSMARPTGDGGRDSELFSERGSSATVFQYSVAVDWRKKIKNTVARLQKLKFSGSRLIYLTNQKIGAGADGVKKICAKKMA